jgi:hypothetical protein
MNPHDNFGPNEPALPNVPDLPPAQVASAGTPASQVPQPQAPGTVPVSPAPPPVAASWLPPTVPVQPAGSGNSGQDSAGTNMVAPAIADDGDVIEKEWVDGAKRIVAQNRQDPYKQARELHRFKAEYLRKRYNKTIEAVED